MGEKKGDRAQCFLPYANDAGCEGISVNHGGEKIIGAERMGTERKKIPFDARA